jgi:hypothetical protein
MKYFKNKLELGAVYLEEGNLNEASEYYHLFLKGAKWLKETSLNKEEESEPIIFVGKKNDDFAARLWELRNEKYEDVLNLTYLQNNANANFRFLHPKPNAQERQNIIKIDHQVGEKIFFIRQTKRLKQTNPMEWMMKQKEKMRN